MPDRCIDCKWYHHSVQYNDEYYAGAKVAKTWCLFRCCTYPTKCRKLDEVHTLECPPWCPILNGVAHE